MVDMPDSEKEGSEDFSGNDDSDEDFDLPVLYLYCTVLRLLQIK